MTFSFTVDDCDITDFTALCDRKTDPANHPNATEIQKNVPIYQADTLDLSSTELLAEWATTLLDGPGVLVIRQAVQDQAALDRASNQFRKIIAAEKAAGASSADHFAAGTNDRIWNSLQKLCLADPASFAGCFGAPALDAVCRAWLGPGYQMTAQVNLVYPGGVAQQAHRDYHLGFQTPEISAQFPAHAHDLSPVLTLQGAVAHCDMPIESGPTKLLPFSQTYRPGYAAYRLPAFREYFEENNIQLPLNKGDTLFFNPALFHAAGDNTSQDIHRLANLLQISSAMGRSLEALDRDKMCRALYPTLQRMPPGPARDAVIAATAEGYSFPTNLDTDPPIGGLAPETQNALTHRALTEGMSLANYGDALSALAHRRRA